ncbi:MAG: hypothetical protein OFPII_22270 [Osedax symbiont Rs1]|nr:MAG: hypothetical protein OFPII_22270 [Osedax symbiont Rs1]
MHYRSLVGLRKQRGTFLLLTLVVMAFLASLSLLGLQNTIQSTKLSRHFLSHSLALQRAQIAIALGEVAIATSFTSNSNSDSDSDFKVNVNHRPLVKGSYPQLLQVDGEWLSAWQMIEQAALWDDENYSVVQKSATAYSNQQRIVSAYIIEKMQLKQELSNVQYYRVTANGVGFNDRSTVLLQTLIRSTTYRQRISWQKIR